MFAWVVIGSVMLSCSASAARVGRVQVVFIEPEPTAKAGEAESYRLVSDTARIKKLRRWMDNESARMALDLFARAWALTQRGRRGERPVYYVALLPGGNNAAVGFHLEGDPQADAHTRTSFIELAPDEWVFNTTLLHETGHVVLSMLNGGAPLPKRQMAAISHTTSALTDRGTAFDEGFAIHLETLAAHFTSAPFLRDRYHHRRFLFGVPDVMGEFHRHAGDLLSYSQTVARYYEVRENDFAFAPAYTGPDYLRVQLEKSRDFAELRDADQLLQSEGFYASFFFSLLVRGSTAPTLEVVHERQGKVLAAMADMLGSGDRQADDPFLLLFVEAYLRRFPSEAGEVIDVLLDLSHGVFVDREAAALWREHYLGALRLDLAERNNKKLEAARARWREAVLRDGKALYANLGPQIRAEVPGQSVTLVAFEESAPVSFDVDTVEKGVMRLVPGISDAEVESWIRTRHEKPFADVEDFRRRSGLREVTLKRITFGQG